MGSNKPVIVQRLLLEGAASTVILSDVDTVWLRDPSPFLRLHPSADVLISTDCLSHWVEAQAAVSRANGSRPVYYHRCGHLPGAAFGRAFNTGVVIFRNRYTSLHPCA
jgi:arabinosyltransferase